MSLINEALKKAQRERGSGPDDAGPSLPGGEMRRTGRGRPPGAKDLLLYGTGGLVLFVLAVVGTVFVLNRPAKPASVAAPMPAPSMVTSPDASAPAIVLPAIAPPPAPSAPPAPAPAVVENPAPGATSPVSNASPTRPADNANQPAADAAASNPPPVATEPVVPTPVAPADPAPAATADERVHAYLDALHVTAFRVQGDDSRIIVDGRVYRVNEIIDRPLSLRMVKVETDRLTFTDARGVVYVKFLQ